MVPEERRAAAAFLKENAMTQERTTLNDPVLRLIEYWIGAQLMHEHVHDLKGILDHEDLLRSGEAIDFVVYLRFGSPL